MKLAIYSRLIFSFGIAFSISSYADEYSGITTLIIRSGSNWTGSVLPSYLTSSPEIAVMRYVIPPQTALPVHKHPAINAAYVVDSEITVVQEGGIQRNFKKGDVIIELVDQWHYGMNQGSKPVELVVFYATTKDLPLAIRKSAS
ncbi:cupin domain-containing protein [Polynucleobacter necessarius]|uniref:cupin domain-containing protein n=1 Tax=Polynucleobacter necessarius TaxID=576610 RepID=UPI000E08E9A4|nr:cupin domain-containing protein [Polynucleobacter necessarius]